VAQHSDPVLVPLTGQAAGRLLVSPGQAAGLPSQNGIGLGLGAIPCCEHDSLWLTYALPIWCRIRPKLSHNSSVAVRFSRVRRERDEVGQLHDQDTPIDTAPRDSTLICFFSNCEAR
jgi:hypothetical protein